MAAGPRKSRKLKSSSETQREAVEELLALARNVAAGGPNPLAELGTGIRALIASEVDPYLLMGVLLEGVVQTLATRIPASRQDDALLASLLILLNRLRTARQDGAALRRCD
jgi:hypothetical protein